MANTSPRGISIAGRIDQGLEITHAIALVPDERIGILDVGILADADDLPAVVDVVGA